ncbi:MAG: ABC transporter permease [Emergencia sp.]|uniref:ABC transporter permease n=1 Tax=Anaerotruncus colihominis TaxID=169435 RepID=A0A845QNS3_9FIRM|nr:ABC transporter permease [Emergencia sp.]MCI9640960.1 ABC transporter permease [Emergencia sp.]NBH62885.1 ABC transporter permease [Anaerotruncus colihominis]NCF00506.1 ABC transporter permease [Emergencia sp. 1XD21-10]NCF03539.1 ABC transporter permease [Anaerotruncus sp. 80]
MQNNSGTVKARTLWADAWRRFKKNKMAVISLIFLLCLALIGIITLVIDWVTNDSIYDTLVISQNLTQRFEPPSSSHILGLDEFGRDILLRILWGTRYSLFMSIAAVLAAGIVGIVIGAVAGYYGGRVDNVIMRLMDVVLSLPYMLLAIAIVAALGPGLVNVLISIAIGYVPEFARITRASVMTIREREFIEAAKAVGASDRKIIFQQILPNAMAPLIVEVTMAIAGAILSIAGLSFLGLGIQPPLPEWGAMLTNARGYIRDAWHITVFPGLVILVTILALNIIGDGLRDALDPKLKN